MDHKKVIVGSIVAMLVLIAVIIGILFSSSLAEPTAKAQTDESHFSILGRIANKVPDVYQNLQAVCVFFETKDRRTMYPVCTKTVDEDSFDLKLDLPLDSAAFNKHGYGFGIITGGFNSSWADPPPKSPNDKGGHQEVGWADRYAIIFNNGTLPEQLQDCHWLRSFPEGYSCAVGTTESCTGFEGFEPVDCSKVVINVDSVENLNWVFKNPSTEVEG